MRNKYTHMHRKNPIRYKLHIFMSKHDRHIGKRVIGDKVCYQIGRTEWITLEKIVLLKNMWNFSSAHLSRNSFQTGRFYFRK